MYQQIKEKIIDLSGQENWDEGWRMQRDNAVLDTRLEGKVLEARVANDVGRFERVKIQFKGAAMVVRCTCSKRSSGYCQHTVATILHLTQNDSELLERVFSSEPKSNIDIPLPPIESEPPAGVMGAATSARDLSWKSFIEQSHMEAHLEVVINGPPPCLESRWKKIELNVSIVYNKRKYSAGNMKQLVEVGAGSGGMKLDDFSIQEQQLMRFLVASVNMVGNRYILNSYDMTDLMHCMSGCQDIFCHAGRVNIHPEPLQLILQVEQKENHCLVVPRFRLAEQGLLPVREPRPIIGRGGAWIGYGTDYWWLSGIADSAWIRSLIHNPPARFTHDELQPLAEACQRRRIPARLVPAAEESEIKAEPGVCQPILSLDWNDQQILATVEFLYKQTRIPIDGPEILWEGDRFVSRDTAREQQALQTLEQMGFHRTEGGKARFALADPEQLLPFVESGFAKLDEDWTVYYSTRFNRKRRATGDLAMRATTRREGESWFELECQVSGADQQPLPLERALEAVRENRRYIILDSGAVARISEELRQTLSFYMQRNEKETETGFRFERFAALPVIQASGSFLRSRKSKWQKLCRKLTAPIRLDQLEIPSPALAKCLRGYQKEGVAWITALEDCGFHGILADEMGLGKTIQALTVLLRRKRLARTGLPSIIVCPTSLVENWHVEAERFTPELRAVIVAGIDRQETLRTIRRDKVDVAITSYALLRRDIEAYKAFSFDYIILDEAQHIKNPETANARTCKALNGEHRLILTGTPVENSLHEIWSLFDFLMPGMLGTRQHFRETYEGAGEQSSGDGTTSHPSFELARQIHPFILRRTKKEVCKQLPPKLEHVVYCEFEEPQRQLYNQLITTGNRVLRKARAEGWNKNRMELLSVLLRLRQLCCHPRLLPEHMLAEQEMTTLGSAKTELLKEIILEAIDGNHRMLIFSQFTKMLKIITDWLNQQCIPYEYLDGATKDRQSRVNRFNRDSTIPVFIISLKAGGTGLNLTGADTVVHYDPWWNPMVEDQATDRTHRIGQANIVTSLKLVARHTIEEKILRLQAGKRELFDQLIGGAPAKIGQLAPDDFEFLLQR